MEVPNFQNWTEGLYLVDAPCGTGKSYFVFHTLYPFAKENNKKLIVFSNRNALKRQQELQAEGTDIELITYQKLEYNQYLNGDWNVRRSVPDLMQELEGYDYIVLDEAHYLFQDARFNRNTEVILSMIERYRLSKVIIMLSATPDLLKSYFGDRIKETYEAEADYSYIQKAYCYTSKDAAYKILDSIPQNEKAVFFGDSRERLKELHRRYSDSAYLCSDNETTSDVFEQITSTERFACRFLFTTKVLDNGVNQAPDIKTEIVHEGEKVTIRLFHDEKIGTLPEYPSYIVTSEGRVYSWNVHRFLHYRFLSQKENKSGRKKLYVRYRLKNVITGKKEEKLAHELVWRCFGDYPIPANGVVHHIDGDSLDNRICNLQAITKEEHDKVQGGFQIAVELKVVDATTFARGGYNWPCTTMQGFERRDKAAEFLNLSIKEFDNLLKRKPEKMFGDTKAWHAPDGRIVLKFPKRYLTKDDLQYFEN